MKKKAPKTELARWDRRSWPKRGDRSSRKLFAAIGAALTAWEYHESTLSDLFSMLVAGGKSIIARRAFSAVRTFEGRLVTLPPRINPG